MMERWCFVGIVVVTYTNKGVAFHQIEVDNFCTKDKAEAAAKVWKDDMRAALVESGETREYVGYSVLKKS